MGELTKTEIKKLQKELQSDGIQIEDSYIHKKLKQKIVKTKFIQDDGYEFTTYVPYIDMNKGVNNEDIKSIAKYLRSIKKYFTQSWIESWKREQEILWDTEYSHRDETKPFFVLQLSLRLENDTLGSPNYASRLRDLRKIGYTITTIHIKGEGYHRIMLPLPTHPESKYEKVPKNITQTLARLKRCIEAYSGKKMDEDFLLADHKFPESRWDENTPEANNPDMSETEILRKFQLLDNASNLRKKQMCESCADSGERPSMYGISFFYKGSKKWDDSIPTRGQEAEKGCVGCPWYDIEKWKIELNKQLSKE